MYAAGVSLKHSSAMRSTSVKRISEAAIARRWITPPEESLIDLTRVGLAVGTVVGTGIGSCEIDVGTEVEAAAGMGPVAGAAAAIVAVAVAVVVVVVVDVDFDGGDGGGKGSILKIDVSVV